MNHRKLALTQLSRVEAAATRNRNMPRTAFTFEGESFAGRQLRVSINDSQSVDFGPDGTCISLAWGIERLQLLCPASLPKEILGIFDPALETEAMPPDLAALVLEAAMLPVILMCEEATGREISIRDLRAASSGAAMDGLWLVLAIGERSWHVHLSAIVDGSASPDPLTSLIQFWPAAPRPMARFHLPATLRIGATVLPFAAFTSLQLGDAVLLEIGDRAQGMLVVAETWTAITKREVAGWRLLEAPRAHDVERLEWTMRSMNTPESELDNAPVSDLDQLPVQLTFDVGRLEMTLAELRRLGAGSVVELGRSITEPIRINAQGRSVGQGELVDIEGMVGVKIVRLFDYE